MTALPAPARIPLLILGLAALLTGVLAGLARLGVDVPSIAATQAGTHAALMICAFFGTVISLERAVALDGLSAYLGPAAAGTGGVLLIAGAPLWVPQSLFVGAALVLLLGSFQVMQRQFALFTVMLALGAVCWLLGNLVWFVNGDLQGAVPFWLAFLVVTIAGERLELTRFLPVRRAAAPSFIALSCLVLGGMLFTPVEPEHGRIAFAAGLLALAAWLLRYDIARHNASQQGLTRFIAICLLSGYVWLATGAIAGLAGGFTPGHALYDAAMHAVALGFVFAMVFGHAPIIFPAVTRIRIPWHPALYLPLALLHLTLLIRVAGGTLNHWPLRATGGLLNALALVAFIATVITLVRKGR